jgi:hypothetical protein
MQLVGSQKDLDKWVVFLDKLASKGLVRVLHISEYYKNGEKSGLYQCEVYVELLVSPK